MKFWEAHRYGDAATSELFEGIKTPHTFNSTEIFWLKQTQKANNLSKFDDYGRKLMITFQMIQPLTDMANIINGNSPIKYRYYSAHDTNIANNLAVYAPTFDWNGIPFASNIYFELYNIYGLWYVRVIYNGQKLTLSGCNDHSMCMFEPFMEHMRNNLYPFD